MRLSRFVLLSWALVFVGGAQVHFQERLSLPPSSDKADLTVRWPGAAAAATKLNPLPLTTAEGAPLSPQPAVTIDPIASDGTVKFHFEHLVFWGEARLAIEAGSGTSESRVYYLLQRGPDVLRREIRVERGRPAEVWLYNHGFDPIEAHWRIVSGGESICLDDRRKLKTDCVAVDNWSSISLAPAQSTAIDFVAPNLWFNPWRIFTGDQREARLELRFGSDASAPLLPIRLRLLIQPHIADAIAIWFPSALAGPALVLNLLWVTVWVTFGAILLMLAQVIIPNFRKSLRMESRMDDFQERLRAIGSRVGDRLYSRCQQEIESLRTALVMRAGARKVRFVSWERIALWGNTIEVSRIESVLPRVDMRLQLTERLDEHSAAGDFDDHNLPPTLYWDREEQLRAIRLTLARQFVSDADAKSVAAHLDELDDLEASLKDFATRLEARVGALRRQFKSDPARQKIQAITKDLPYCLNLLDDTVPFSAAGLTDAELRQFDLAAVRLEIARQMLDLDGLLSSRPDVAADVKQRLQSADPSVLANASAVLLELSQGVSEADVSAALTTQKWDCYYEPSLVSDQDVLRSAFVFREKRIDVSTAKKAYECFWCITSDGGQGATRIDEDWEHGWEVQFIPRRGKVKIMPHVYDRKGVEVAIRSEADKEQGNLELDVEAPSGGAMRSRLLRGFLDAVITAVVPVISVAITQADSGGGLGIDRLTLLGFSSQAIRTAILPERSTAAGTPSDKPGTTTPG